MIWPVKDAESREERVTLNELRVIKNKELNEREVLKDKTMDFSKVKRGEMAHNKVIGMD
jgi:hypothetical protein